MHPIGFSTGALAKGDFDLALGYLLARPFNVLELSALRVPELPLLLRAIPAIDLRQFTYIALHAPSSFTPSQEPEIVEVLARFPHDWKIILHPDTIHNPNLWLSFGRQLAIENMDGRKPDGRSTKELSQWFARLPEAQFCLDLAHARQWDRTMMEAYQLLKSFSDRICQVHISQLDSVGRHYPMASSSVRAFSEVAWLIPDQVPFIIESRIDPAEKHDYEVQAEMDVEVQKVRTVVDSTSVHQFQPTPV